MMRRAFLRGLASALLAAASTVPAADGLPYHLAVRVVPGETAGSERIVAAVRESLLTQLEAEGCFLSVRPFEVGEEPPEPFLVLAVSVTEERNELEYEQSMSQRIESQDPDDEFRRFAIVRIAVAYVLQLEDAATPVRWQRFRPTVRRRPMHRGEDPQETALREIVYDIGRKGRMFACSDKSAKLRKRVERARREAAGAR